LWKVLNLKIFHLISYQQYVDQNKLNIQAGETTYKLRQQIVEHPFGIIKRQWGFYFITTKRGIKRASADVGLIFTAYNLRRLFNILDKKVLEAVLRKFALFFSLFKTFLQPFYRIRFIIIPSVAQKKCAINSP